MYNGFMPVHDWTKTYQGAFHHLHVTWLVEIARALNDGLLPPGYYALGEEPRYPPRPRVIAVRHRSGDRLVALIEIVSAGNRTDPADMGSLVEKTVVTLSKRINVVSIDLHPPGPFDPRGIHNLVWTELGQQAVDLPSEKPLQVVSYLSEGKVSSLIEPLAVGDRLPDAPLFLEGRRFVPLPLESTYMRSFDAVPRHLREEVEGSSRGPSSEPPSD